MENAKDHGIHYNYMNLAGIYRGEIKNGVPDGLGDYTYSDENDATNNIRIGGTWQNGVLISGTRYQGDAGDECKRRCVFTGFFHANGQVREGAMTFSGGVEFHGTFHEDGDFKHGRMTHLGIDGNGWYEGDFVNGVRNGTGELHEDGVVFTGTWKDDVLHGKGTMEVPNGTIYDGMWNDHHFDGSIMYSNGVNREFIGYLKHDGEKAVGHSEDMSVTNSDPHLTYEGDFEDNMPVGFGSIMWLSINVALPVFSHAFHSFCIVSPKQYRQLIQAGILEELEDPISLDVIDSNTRKFHLLHFGLKLDQTADVQLWHPVDILAAASMKLNTCPLCRIDYPRPLMDWIKREVQTNAATRIQRLVRSRTRTRTKKRASAATKIQRFVRSMQHKTRKSHGRSRGGTKRSNNKKRKSKRTAKRR